MGFWLFMLFFNLLIPVIMILTGRAFTKKSPKEINYIYGYRTDMSMKNSDTWDFAHKCCGRFWYKWGIIVLAATVVVMLILLTQSIKVVSIVGSVTVVAQMISLLAVIPHTEKALRRNFDKDGNRIDVSE